MNHKPGLKRCTGIILITAVIFILGGCSPRGNPQALFDKGQELARQENFEESAKQFYEYIRVKPDDPRGFQMLYRALMGADRTDEAYTMLTRGLEKHPDDSDLNLEMGQFFINKGMFEKAKEKLDTASELNPGNPTPKYLKGILLVQEGNDREAYDVFKDLISLNPDDSETNREAVTLAYTFLFEIIGTLGRSDNEAFSVITKGINFMPDYGRGYTVLGIYFYNKKELDSALKRFEIAIQKGQDSESGKNTEAYAYRLIGRIYDQQGNREKALENYRKFLNAYSPDGRARIHPKDAAEVRIYSGIIEDVLDIQGVRDRVRELER